MALVGGANHDVWGASVISDSGRVGSLGIPRQNRMATSSPTTSAATRADHKESEECVLERSHRATIRAFAGRDRCGPAFVTQPPWDFVTLPPRPPPSRYPFAGGFRYSTLSNGRGQRRDPGVRPAGYEPSSIVLLTVLGRAERSHLLRCLGLRGRVTRSRGVQTRQQQHQGILG